MMGLVKAWQMEQAEKEYDEDIKQWWYERTGNRPEVVTSYMVEEYELDQAFAHAISKDD